MLVPARIEAPDSKDERWNITIDGFHPFEERAAEALLALANGYLGIRGSLPEGSDASDAGTFVAGVFQRPDSPGSIPEIARLPNLFALRVNIGGDDLVLDAGDVLDHTRRLDLWRAEWTRTWRDSDRRGRITSMRYTQCVSLADCHALLQRLEIMPENYSAEITVIAGDSLSALANGSGPSVAAAALVAGAPSPVGTTLLSTQGIGPAIRIAVASEAALEPRQSSRHLALGPVGPGEQSWTWPAEAGRRYRIDRLISVHTTRDSADPAAAAALHLRTLLDAGAVAGFAAHEREWAHRWQAAAIDLDGDPAIAKALHLAAYHLISSANPREERASIGARGLTGIAYLGHVFWDTEIFMLPFFLCTEPAAARALLMYRYNTLPAAREKARGMGFRGALYAWESAGTGEEATPPSIMFPNGEKVSVLSGEREHHISADIAFAVWRYWRVTADDAFFIAYGAEIVLETARFWTSRATAGTDGRFHIRTVIGPDEYHDDVDDNAYTNLLARWNLRRGRQTAAWLAGRDPEAWRALAEKLGLSKREIEAWGDIADGLVDGLDSRTGVIEQFRGYAGLEDVELSRFEPRSVPMDMLLGHDRIVKTKVIKQADVLMALALLWDEFTDRVRAANFAYYEPRTGHGSSLSPGVHALLAARLGDLGRAERYLRQTAAIDLDDQMANAAGGMHLGALGSLWQAVVFGFAGVELLDDSLAVCPRLPPRWKSLGIPLAWRGRRLYLLATSSPAVCEVTLESGAPLVVLEPGSSPRTLAPGGTLRFETPGRRWELREEAQA